MTLHHDDEGEDGYANWWQVERLDGTRLGRRELLHPHSNQPFTRSNPIEIPNEVTSVVVRGHDQSHGDDGVAMIVNLDTGAMRSVDQGPKDNPSTKKTVREASGQRVSQIGAVKKIKCPPLLLDRPIQVLQNHARNSVRDLDLTPALKRVADELWV